MIPLSTRFIDIVSQNVFTTFHMVAIRRLTSPVHLTDYFVDLVFDGNTYSANSGLISIQQPTAVNVVDRAPYKITYADSDLTASLWLERESLTGTLVSVYLGLIDPDTDEPILTPADVLLVYEGFLDTAPRRVELGGDGSAVVELNLVSPMGSLDLKRSVISSDEFMRGLVSHDTSFNQVHEGSRQIAMRWGKI